MDVQDTVPESPHEHRRENPHEARQADKAHAVPRQQLQEGAVVGGAVRVGVRIQVARLNTRPGSAAKCLGVATIADHQGDPCPQPAGGNRIEDGLKVGAFP